MASDHPELNDHLLGAGFDPDVCNGDHPAVDGPCPKYVDGVIGRCGDCGCPMATMYLAQGPPVPEDDDGDGCPRVGAHTDGDVDGDGR